MKNNILLISITLFLSYCNNYSIKNGKPNTIDEFKKNYEYLNSKHNSTKAPIDDFDFDSMAREMVLNEFTKTMETKGFENIQKQILSQNDTKKAISDILTTKIDDDLFYQWVKQALKGFSWHCPNCSLENNLDDKICKLCDFDPSNKKVFYSFVGLFAENNNARFRWKKFPFFIDGTNFVHIEILDLLKESKYYISTNNNITERSLEIKRLIEKDFLKYVNSDIYFCGHSLGALHISEILNDLTLENNNKIKGFISMAGPLRGISQQFLFNNFKKQFNLQSIDIVNSLASILMPVLSHLKCDSEYFKNRQDIKKIADAGIKVLLLYSSKDTLVTIDSATCDNLKHENITLKNIEIKHDDFLYQQEVADYIFEFIGYKDLLISYYLRLHAHSIFLSNDIIELIYMFY